MPQQPKPEADGDEFGQPGQAVDVDTIAAIATAPGQAGVGIVRISGPEALLIAGRIAGSGLRPREIAYRKFRTTTGSVIDSGIVLQFAGPASFTGEDVVEFQGHGGPVVLQMMLEEIVKQGARLARAGEFTERAYLNGKLDLAQAEAVADLIASASVEAVKGANRSLAGEFSKRIGVIDSLVVEVRMFVEAAIDFADEDIDFLADGQVAERILQIVLSIEELLSACTQGVLLRDGVSIALVGNPNVGKSSLLNRLSGEARAIVTDIPGTTRDLIHVDLVLDGLPVEIVDTAGLRASQNAVEKEGVRRAIAQAETADIVLLIVGADDEQSRQKTEQSLLPQALIESDKTIRVVNKIDLIDPASMIDVQDEQMVAVSALTGQGIAHLRSRIREKAGFAPKEAGFTARKRHLIALEEALKAAKAAHKLALQALESELIAEELKAVHGALGEIVGQMSSDELLGEIFSRFCIGK